MHDALALHLDVTAFLEDKVIAESFVSQLRHLDASNGNSGLHPRRDVDGVAPHVVEEALRPDHASYHRSARHTDPQRHGAPARISQSGNGVRDVQSEVGQRFKMVRTWLWDAADHHVRVTAGLHLLQAVPGYQRIQAGVEVVEERDQLFWRGVAGPLGVARDICEKY